MIRRLVAPLAAAALVLSVAGCGDGEPEPRETELFDLGSSDGGGEQPNDGGGGEPSDGGGEVPGEGGGEESVNAAPDIPAPDPANFPGMDENTEQGAISAFRFYVAVSVWSHQTGDKSSLQELESGMCEGCAEFNADLPELRERGDYWGDVAIYDVAFWRSDSPHFDHRVTYQYTLSPHTRTAVEVGERMELPTLEYAVVGGMAWDGERWVVDGLAAEWGEDVFK